MDELRIKYYGYLFDASGYGHAARGYVHALHAAGTTLSAVNLSNSGKQVADPLVESLLNKAMRPDIHIFHGIPWGWERHLSNLVNTIALTVWETNTMPRQWQRLLNRMREVWLPCEFNIAAFRSGLRVPVFKLPHALLPIETNGYASHSRWALKLRESDYVFYSIFEWQDRKNPLGLLEAYLRAFPKDEGTLLLIKTNPTAASVAYRDVEYFRRKTGSPARIEIFCEGWSEAEIDGLHARGDCYVSLHRGEGWGIPAFIAAGRGKPVIATNFSGPTEYLDSEAHHLVRYHLTGVKQRYAFYHASMQWAEPDLEHAIERLRWVNEHREPAATQAQQAASVLRERYSPQFVGETARTRLLACLGRKDIHKASGPTAKMDSLPTPIPPEWYDADYFEYGRKSNWRQGYTWQNFASLFRSTATFLCDSFPHAELYLDAGCAKGFLIHALREKGKTAFGFDHSPWAVSHALSEAMPFIIQADVEHVQFECKFDLLLAFSILSHLSEAQARAFLQRAKTWVNIGLLATMPTFASEKEVQQFKLHDNDPSHMLLKSRDWWHEFFLSAGWKQDGLHRLLQQQLQQHELPRSMNWQIYLYSAGE